jgi:hypothetical protein
MKKALLIIATGFLFYALLPGTAFCQTNFDDFDGNKRQHFGLIKGILDSSAANPRTNSVNPSPRCAKYDRATGGRYGFIKMYPLRKLSDVSSYATHTGTPQKMKLKVYTSAPVGTLVEIQLGRKGDDNYPAGVHSQYQAYTTVRNAWEELTFTFSQIPEGSLVAPTDVDKITLLFYPNSSNTDTYYFDDLTGPSMAPETLTGVINDQK